MRTITADEKPLPEAEEPKGPNQEQLPHVSEEAAMTGKITGEGGPELDQGTPVKEVCVTHVRGSMSPANETMKVLQRDEKAEEKVPQVMRQDKVASSHTGTRSYSTSARRHAFTQNIVNPQSGAIEQVEGDGHIFGLPRLPIPSTSHIKHRYDPVIEQVTNLLMQDGKKSKAQRVGQSVPLFFAISSQDQR